MNDRHCPKPAELCIQDLLDKTENFVRKEPTTAVAIAVGAGLLLKLLPTRALVSTITEVTVRLLPPALMTLGVIKAFELGCQKAESHSYEEPPLRLL